VTENARESVGGHLAYYREHAIVPVQYQFENLRAHVERRDGLYRSLGLPPAAFRAVRVLEVAPGTGQNSVYVASCMPETLDLVEPNPASLAAIENVYAPLTLRHTRPRVHGMRLEEFDPAARFDVVLCENWLGGLPNELALIGKLAGLVAPGGVLVLTVVPFSGFFPNVMRKLLGLRVVGPGLDFEAKTQLLLEAFAPHLSTIANMTRSHRDWVQDCLLNPHYLNVALPLEAALDAVGADMEALATFPRFGADWRWFKALTGAERRFNENLLQAFRRNTHNFLDYRRVWPERAAEANASLDAACQGLHMAAIAWHAAFQEAAGGPLRDRAADISRLLEAMSGELADVDPSLSEATSELRDVWNASEVTTRMIARMEAFGALFGRETVYLSLTRRT
jgi:SAM-dependent methyltransferase